MTVELLSAIALAFAAIPFALYAVNAFIYRCPPVPPASSEPCPRVSVLIPARDEESSIGDAVRSVLRSEGVDLEVIVLDDHSRDATRSVVEGIALHDARVAIVSAPPLPAGWCGKQHACWELSRLAKHSILVFLDADVRVEPQGLARAVRFLETSHSDLVSGVPAQRTVTLLEQLLIPLIHFFLLGLLPIARMRRTRHPAYSAGCGQLFIARRDAYDHSGGHSAIPKSLHDGVALPAAFRRAGFVTDLFDATVVARCRMYRGAGEVWRGLVKNAVEGFAHPKRILPVTGLLFGGQILPPALLVVTAAAGSTPDGNTIAIWLSSVGTLCALLPRFHASWRFSQPLLGALLHPFGVALFLGAQWWALALHWIGRPQVWKGRAYEGQATTGPDLPRPAKDPEEPSQPAFSAKSSYSGGPR